MKWDSGHHELTISCLDQSYVPSCGVKQFVKMKQQAKKWRFKKLLILLIFYFHLEAHVKNGLWGEYQHRLWRNSDQGGLNSILSFLAFNIFSPFYADFKRKSRYFCHDNSNFRWSGNQAIMSLQFHVLINLIFRVVVWKSSSKWDNKQKSDDLKSCWFC